MSDVLDHLKLLSRASRWILLSFILVAAGCAATPEARLYQLAKNNDLNGIDQAIAESGGRLTYGKALLAAAGLKSDAKTIRYLFTKVPINYQDPRTLETPLMRASSVPNNDIVINTILALGVSINVTDKRGWTALDFAHYAGLDHTARLLAGKGAIATVSAPDLRAYKAAEDAEIARQIEQDNQEIQQQIHPNIVPPPRALIPVPQKPALQSGQPRNSAPAGIQSNGLCPAGRHYHSCDDECRQHGWKAEPAGSYTCIPGGETVCGCY